MLQIEGITSEARQRHLLPIEGSDVAIDMLLVWKETQNAWFVDLTWGSWAVAGIKLCHFPNILSSWANVLPFGIMIACDNLQDPFLMQSFSNGSAKLYVLTAAEVADLGATYG